MIEHVAQTLDLPRATTGDVMTEVPERDLGGECDTIFFFILIPLKIRHK